MSVLFQNARILTPFSQQDGAVLVTGDRITDVSRALTPPRGTRVVDAQGLYLVPGYIDLHVHGGGGHHVMEGTPEAVQAMCDAHAAEGTTTLLPTTTTASMDAIKTAIDAVRMAADTPCKGSIAGVHLQGPFLSPVHMKEASHGYLCDLKSTDWQSLISHWDGIRMVGLSPELPGALAVGDALHAQNIVASIAHSDASYDQVLSAVSHGFTDVSGLYTSSSSLREINGFHVPGVTETALAMDELTVQVVADGKRLPLLVLEVIFRCKGAESILLVSDSKEDHEKSNMAMLVRNMVAAGISLRVALRMATVNPARRIGIDQTKGKIANGYDADILLLDDALNLRFCMAMGEVLRDEL